MTISLDPEAYEESIGLSSFKICWEMNELWSISEGSGEVK